MQKVLNGIYRALEDGQRQFGITFRLIMCFIRDATLENAIACYTDALPIAKSGKYPNLVAIGLDSDEMGNPPSKFKQVKPSHINILHTLALRTGQKRRIQIMRSWYQNFDFPI